MVSKLRNGVTCTFPGCGRAMRTQYFKEHFILEHLRVGEPYNRAIHRRYEVVRESNVLPVAAPVAAAPVAAAPVAAPVCEQRISADTKHLPKKQQYVCLQKIFTAPGGEHFNVETRGALDCNQIRFKAEDVANAFCFLLGDIAESAPDAEIVTLTIAKKRVKYLTLLGLVRALALLNTRPGFIYLDQLELLPGAKTNAASLKEGQELFTYGKTRQPEEHRNHFPNYKATEVFSVPVDGYSYSTPETTLTYFLGDNGLHTLRSDVSGEMCVLTKKDVDAVCREMTRLKLKHPPKVYFDAETVMGSIRTAFKM